MTPDERLEALLNRAGQTISDLPKAYSLSTIEAKDIQETACQWLISEGAPEGVALRNLVSIPLYQYILHLTDVIDRMEWALENVCGERDYLLHEYIGCEDCAAASEYDDFENEICHSCENESKFEWSMPEDWSADDD